MAKDPYHYFRIEAGEHIDGLASGILELEKRKDDREVVARLLRHAHTLKGAARVVRQPEISELSHAIEELLGPLREPPAVATREDINQLLKLVDSITRRVKALAGPDQPTPPNAAADPQPQPPTDRTVNLDSIRIATAELDPLLYGIWEAGINVAALRDQSVGTIQLIETASSLAEELRGWSVGVSGGDAAVQRRVLAAAENLRSSLSAFRQGLLGAVDKTRRELAQLQDQTLRLRLLPADSVFPSLERAVRDAADALGKRVDFRTTGGEHRLDAHVLRLLHDALLHLVRNAVSHGVEPPDQRVEAGKPAAGRVEVRVERRGNRLTFACRDDGRGVDVEQVRRVAIERGLLSPEDDSALPPEQAMQILFRSGISTAGAVTEHAGRGIGLDVVRETVERLHGSVEMSSEPSRGTSVEVTVPVSLESMPALEVESAGYRVCFPFESVRRVLLVPDEGIARSPQGDSILFEDAHVPLLCLRSLLFPQAPPEAGTASARVVVIESGQDRAAVTVDRALGRAVIILKPLPPAIGRMELVIGACLDTSGDPQPVLDPSALIRAAHKSPGAATSARPAAKPRVLVIDDSLTSRMLEQSILETAGYEVDVAASGEEALSKAKQQAYAVFVVDVEMPGMSGFEFIAKVKADPDLRHVPAILVTSRAGAEDRARGEAVGAAAYIVKGEFEEAGFLRTVRRLVGKEQ